MTCAGLPDPDCTRGHETPAASDSVSSGRDGRGEAAEPRARREGTASRRRKVGVAYLAPFRFRCLLNRVEDQIGSYR